MNPIRTLQTQPVTANDLFAQLAASSAGAVKTRERLFTELKAELELRARLEQDHLLPVLRKHTGTKTLVAAVTEGLKASAALLAEIDAMPRDSDDFVAKVGELKKLFQQHLRDQKNELIPAVQKALSDEETAAVAEKFAATRAEAEAAAAKAEERARATARREREAAAQVKAAAEEAERVTREAAANTRRAAKAMAETARVEAEAGREAIETGVRANVALARRAAEQVGRTLDTGREATAAFGAMAASWQASSREWMAWSQGRMQTRMQAVGQLMACRTPQDLVALQARLIREEADQFAGVAGRVAEIASGATSKLAQRASA